MHDTIHLLRINGTMKESPLLEVSRRLHAIFTELGIPYAVVGGLAVVRHGAARTTQDIDILVEEERWRRVREALQNRQNEFETYHDHAREKQYDIEIDILFPGNAWEMIIPIPNPERVREYDRDYGIWFIDFLHLLELKTAVYMKKKEEDGIEIAAKDLADIVALIQAHRDSITEERFQEVSLPVRKTLHSIVNNVLK